MDHQERKMEWCGWGRLTPLKHNEAEWENLHVPALNHALNQIVTRAGMASGCGKLVDGMEVVDGSTYPIFSSIRPISVQYLHGDR